MSDATTNGAGDEKPSAQGTPFSTPRMVELEAELAATRAQLAATVDELAGRLTPRALADQGAQEAKRVWADAVGSDASPRERTRARMILGGVVAAGALVAALALRGRGSD